jgi:REP element-mobilizing transposase RayT
MSGYDPQKHHRRSIRLPGWDYRSAAAYFVTICTHQRERLFDDPLWAEIAANAWRAIPNHVERAVLDEWVLMPNHLHGILVFRDDSVAPLPVGPVDLHWVSREDDEPRTPLTNAPAGSLGSIIRSYKAAVTRQINRLRQTSCGKVWQRGYFERIVRDGPELERIRAYIRNNPDRWAAEEDDLNRLLTGMNLRV